MLGAGPHFVPRHLHQSQQQKPRVILGLKPVVLIGLPITVSIWGGLLHLSFPGGSLISFALQSRSAGCAVPLPRQFWLFPRTGVPRAAWQNETVTRTAQYPCSFQELVGAGWLNLPAPAPGSMAKLRAGAQDAGIRCMSGLSSRSRLLKQSCPRRVGWGGSERNRMVSGETLC